MFAIVDVNNFYASCERIFRPDLANKPVVVLSNNDGCIIARSNEAKILGIKMGVPYFKVKDICKNNDIHVFSSNYALYGDISSRFVKILEDNFPKVEIYSIDEVFLDLCDFNCNDNNIVSRCEDIVKLVQKNLGIPISIGIGKTKTIAKLASFVAKKKLKKQTLMLNEQEKINYWLKSADLEDIWNISWGYSKRLREIKILSPYDLKISAPNMIRDKFGINLFKTLEELNERPCIVTESSSSKKSITVAKSLGNPTKQLRTLEYVLSEYCAIACEKLRKQKLNANGVYVLLKSNRFKEKRFSAIKFSHLAKPSSDTRDFFYISKKILKSIFKAGVSYNKVGIILTDISSNNVIQEDLFDVKDKDSIEKSNKLMNVIDKINKKMGRGKVFFSSQGLDKNWIKEPINKSQKYTTAWSEIPVVKCK